MKTAVVVDSGSNIYNTDIEATGLFKVPLQLAINNEVFQENEVTHERVIQLLKEEADLKTSLPAIGILEELFKEIKELGYEKIFAIPMNPAMSSTYYAMESAAKMMDIEITMYNNYGAAEIELYQAVIATEMFQEGKDEKEVITCLDDITQHSKTFILPEKLDNIAKSGRLSPVAARLAGLLRIVPILMMNHETDGTLEAVHKTRTMRRAIKHLIDIFKEDGVNEDYRVCIMHVDNLEMAEQFATYLTDEYPNIDYFITDLIPSVSVHTDIGCIAVQYLKKV